MLVSQYIYTACGKDRNGAFSVFSKSKDITEEESSEIREIMMYKTPPGLPFEPTEAEIEEKFPKKFGYFLLSSGRACLAHVCYVGQVYSDLDSRWGNYIIHAFVFKKTNNISPYSLIGHDIFKRGLTRKEWHDDAIPDSLPPVEIPENGVMLSADEISSFFNEDRWNKLKVLIEAIINSTAENCLHFNDDHKNIKYWLKILSLCLPKEMQNNISICSHFTNSIVPGNASSRIQIRINRPDGGQFNCSQEAQRGNLAFDFAQNTAPDLSPKKYAQTIVKLAKVSAFEAVKFVSNINNVMNTYHVNINEAADLINLLNEDYAEFADVDNFYDTIMLADRVSYEVKTIAEKLTAKKHSFTFNSQQQLSVYAFVFKNISSINTRVSIIRIIISNSDRLGISSGGAVVFRDELKSKAGFIFDNYYDYLKSDKGLTDYITQNSNSFARLFVAFDYLACLPSLKNAFQAKNFTGTEETLACKTIMDAAYKRKSLQDIDILIKSANASVNNLGVEWLCIVVNNSLSADAKPANLQFAFDILRRVQPKNDFAGGYLLNLIKTSSGQDEFVKIYMNSEKDNKEFFAKFENDHKNDSLMKDFSIKKDAYYFTTQPLSVQALRDYFNKYYVKGADTGLFVRRLGEYLRSVKEDKKTSECITLLNEFKFQAEAEKFAPPVLTALLDAVFSQNYEDLFRLFDKRQDVFNKLLDAYNTVTKEGSGLKQDTSEKINLIQFGRIIEKYDFKVKNDILTLFYSKEQKDAEELSGYIQKINSNGNINLLIEWHFLPIVNLLIFGATLEKQKFDYEGVLEKAFGKIIEKGDVQKIVSNVEDGIKQSKPNAIVFILYIFRKHLSASGKSLDRKLGDIAEKYLEKLSGGDRKKRFSELLEKAEDKEKKQFEKYFEDFNKKHPTGFFSFLKK